MTHNEHRDDCTGVPSADAAETAPPSIKELLTALDSETARETLRRRYEVDLPTLACADGKALETGAERRKAAIFNSW